MELAAQGLVYVHDCCVVVEFSAVVWSRKDCYELPAREKFEAVLDNLVSSADKVDVMFSAKLLYNVGAKNEGNSSVVWLPAVDLVRVSP